MPDVNVSPEAGQMLAQYCVHLTCKICKMKETVNSPIDMNAWVKNHLETYHSVEAAQIDKMDRRIRELEARKQKAVIAFNKRIEDVMNFEQGKVVTVPPSRLIKPS